MPRMIKRITVVCLKPIAKLLYMLSPLQRLWAHTCLAAKLKNAVDISVVAYSCPEIQGTANIQLGQNLLLYRELYWETQVEGKIIIGDEVVMSRGVHLVAFYHIDIGQGSMIGEYTSIRDANHHFGQGKSVRHSGYSGEPIIIGNNVWIGRGVTILAGVSIGDNAVIGANAVVTKDVPANALAAGIPAGILRTLET